MNKTTKITLIALATAGILLLLVFGLKSKTSKTTTAQPATTKTETAQQKTPDPTATTAPLPPLPTDNKQAIESEVQGIDQELQQVDASLSADTPDSSLGL